MQWAQTGAQTRLINYRWLCGNAQVRGQAFWPGPGNTLHYSISFQFFFLLLLHWPYLWIFPTSFSSSCFLLTCSSYLPHTCPHPPQVGVLAVSYRSVNPALTCTNDTSLAAASAQGMNYTYCTCGMHQGLKSLIWLGGVLYVPVEASQEVACLYVFEVHPITFFKAGLGHWIIYFVCI